MAYSRRVEIPVGAELLEFWFGRLDGDSDHDGSKSALWWGGGDETDREIRERFGDLVDRALAGELDDWADSARGRLALIIAHDQLPRSIWRGTPRAFSGDARAQALVIRGIERADDSELRLIERAFFYMPLMHAEDPALADRSLEQYAKLSDEIAAKGAELPDFASHARQHAEIVKRFGRYPHRNEVLGRASTDAERAFLEGGGPRFGQTAK